MHTTKTTEQVLETCFKTNSDLVFTITEHQYQQQDLDFDTDKTYKKRTDILLPIVKDLIEYKSFDECPFSYIDIMYWRLYQSTKIFFDYIDDLLAEGVKGKTLAELTQTAQTIAYNEFLDLILESV